MTDQTPPTGLTVQQTDALWDAVAIPGPDIPTFTVQHERVCHAVAGILAELPPATPTANRAAVLLWAADWLRGLSMTGTAISAQEIETELRRLAAEARQPDTEAPTPVSPAYARLQAAAHKAAEAAHLHAMHGMKRTFQLALSYGNQPIPAAEVLNALGLDENANTVEPAAPAPVPDPTWPRRAWDLGLLHKGGDPHHCPACVAQPEPPKDFICPGAEANAEVLANPQPAVSSAVPGRSTATNTSEETSRIVAYRSALPGAWSLYCTRHVEELGACLPLTSEDLPNGGVCAKCHVDVLIPRNGATS